MAITLSQPKATLAALGKLKLHSRGWSTDYRGLLAIHAHRELSIAAVKRCFEEPFCTVLHAAGVKRVDELPLGRIVAVVNLTNCRPADVVRALLPMYGPNVVHFGGDFGSGQFALEWQPVVRLKEPIKVRGDRGIWKVPKYVDQQLMAHVIRAGQRRRSAA